MSISCTPATGGNNHIVKLGYNAIVTSGFEGSQFALSGVSQLELSNTVSFNAHALNFTSDVFVESGQVLLYMFNPVPVVFGGFLNLQLGGSLVLAGSGDRECE